MLWYAIFVTFMLGLLSGSVITVLVALRMEAYKVETTRRQTIHPSRRVGPNPFKTPITLFDEQ